MANHITVHVTMFLYMWWMLKKNKYYNLIGYSTDTLIDILAPNTKLGLANIYSGRVSALTSLGLKQDKYTVVQNLKSLFVD